MYRTLLLFLCSLLAVNGWTSDEGRARRRSPPTVFLSSRRQVHQHLIAVLGGGTALTHADAANAGEVGARITKAVTTSDLGISVRRSVVKGAQVMDGLDGQWEQFSDRLGLGSNRKIVPGRPLPKKIPPPQPLDGALAAQLLDLADQVFCSLTKVSAPDLRLQVSKLTAVVGPSFARSGLDTSQINPQNPMDGDQYNFLAYVHFKAYTDLILERNVDFRIFQRDFERQMGPRVESLLLVEKNAPGVTVPSGGSLSDTEVRQARWQAAQKRLQQLSAALVDRGLISQIDSSVDTDDLLDWFEDVDFELAFNVALDGDVTLDSQVLLQEQGRHFYPAFGRYAVRTVLQRCLDSNLEITDFYMDTNYNSDPDKFQVREVLLSILLETG